MLFGSRILIILRLIQDGSIDLQIGSQKHGPFHADPQMNPVLGLVRNYGIALVVVGALIWIPYTGFFLTILTFGLLPALICNLFLIHLACAALIRQVGLGWLVVPIACYGAWLGWAIWQNSSIISERNRLESENRITVPVPQNVTLVFPEKHDELSFKVRQHIGPPLRVFVGSRELAVGLPSFCQGDQYFERDSRCAVGPPSFCQGPNSFKDSRCVVLPSSTPPNDAIVFHRLHDLKVAPAGYLPRYELTQNTTTGDHIVGHFTFGRLFAPVWAPVFRAGCYLIDDPAAWKCVISPMFRRVAVGETGDPTSQYNYDTVRRAAKTLANMLGAEFIDSER